MATPNQILKKRVKETLKNLRNNQKSTVKDILGELNKTKTEMTTILKNTTRFEQPYYRAILRGLDEKIDEFTAKMSSSVTAGQGQAFKAGEDLIPSVFKEVGYGYTFGKLSDELIVTAKELTVDYIKDMSGKMKKDIARRVRKGLLQGEGSFDVARGIDGVIGVNKRRGYLNRADIIARQEIGRVYSIARQARDDDAVEKVPQLKKQWLTGFNPRHKDMGGGRGFISHSDVDGQIRDVDKPFDVGGEQLMAPRLGKKAENNIGCNCESVPYMEEWSE